LSHVGPDDGAPRTRVRDVSLVAFVKREVLSRW